MIPIVKNIKRFFSLKELLIVLFAVAFSVSAGFGVFLFLEKDVVINDGGRLLTVKTMKSTVSEALEQSGISVKSYDYVSMPLNSRLQRINSNVIYIKRAVPVNIYADGKNVTFMTYKDTVKQMLAESPVRLSGLDRLEGANPDDKIVKDMTVRVIRVSEKTVVEKEAIPYQTVTRQNNRLNQGTERVARPGQEGVREKQYKVVTEDGREVLKQLLTDSVALAPVNMIMEYGTVLNHKTARGDVIRYSKVMDMRATAYTASFKDTGKNPGDPYFGITATGIKAKKGVIAVDPRVIPLGTRVYVEVAGDTPDYGYAVAADTGGAIKGSLIDLYYDTQGFVDRWGVKHVKVYILLDD